MNNVTFNDEEVEVEIFDAVLGKSIVTDFSETDDTKLSYLRNRDKIAIREQLNVKEVNLDDLISNDFPKDVSINSVGNLKLQAIFKPVVGIEEGAVFLAFEISDQTVLPELSIRFGHVWNLVSMEVVGVCSFSNIGLVNIKLLSNVEEDDELVLLV